MMTAQTELSRPQARVAADKAIEPHEILLLDHADSAYLHTLYMRRLRHDMLTEQGRKPKASSKATRRRRDAPKSQVQARRRLDRARSQALEAGAEVQAIAAEIQSFAGLVAEIEADAEAKAGTVRRQHSQAKGLATRRKKAALGVLQDDLSAAATTLGHDTVAGTFTKLEASHATYRTACATASTALAEAAEATSTRLTAIECECTEATTRLRRKHAGLPAALKRAQSIMTKRLSSQDSAERQARSLGIEIESDEAGEE